MLNHTFGYIELLTACHDDLLHCIHLFKDKNSITLFDGVVSLIGEQRAWVFDLLCIVLLHLFLDFSCSRLLGHFKFLIN